MPADLPEHAELAIDRRVLREQASPWRYFDGQSFRRRAQRGAGLAATLPHGLRDALSRVDGPGPTSCARGWRKAARRRRRWSGWTACAPWARPPARPRCAPTPTARAALDALPAEPDGQQARTAGVTLGLPPAAFEEAEAAIAAVRRALEQQLRRLASRTVRIVLERQRVAALDRLLQAITASDVGGIERALDDRLAAHIDRLLAEAAESPLSRLAADHPTVTAQTLDRTVTAFRELLEQSIAAADDGRAVL